MIYEYKENRYRFSEKAKLKKDGEWVDCVIYLSDDFKETYVREEKDFNEKFRKLSDYELMTDNPDFGDLYTVSDFDNIVEEGFINDDDGSGYYGTDTKHSRLEYFSNQKPDWATHVLWFNK